MQMEQHTHEEYIQAKRKARTSLEYQTFVEPLESRLKMFRTKSFR